MVRFPKFLIEVTVHESNKKNFENCHWVISSVIIKYFGDRLWLSQGIYG